MSCFPASCIPSRRDDADLRQLVHDMGDDVGPEAFVRQQTAIISRPDSRPTLAWIKCPTLVLSGDEDNTSRIRCRWRWRAEFPARNSSSLPIAAT